MKRSPKRIALIAVMAAASVICLCAAVLLHTVSGLLDRMEYVEEDAPPTGQPEQVELENYTPEDLSTLTVRGNNDYVTNFLLVGCDARGSGRGLADSVMILSINDATDTISIVSLMRDTWVTVPALGYQAKLNAAYSHGGFEWLLDTVAANFCLDIGQAVRVDFAAFTGAIDVLGGIDVYVDERAARCIPKEDPGDPDSFAVASDWKTQIREPIGYTAGTYHLQGFQALSFCRLRKIYADSDYTRTQNQRRVIAALMTGAMQNPTRLYRVLSTVLAEVSLYRIRKSEIMGYLADAGKYSQYDIRTDYRLRYTASKTPTGASVLLLDGHEQQVQALHEYLYRST